MDPAVTAIMVQQLTQTGVIAQNNAALRTKSLALVAAENQMAELRLARLMPSPGRQVNACRQGRLLMQCESIFTNSDNTNIRQVTVRVHPDGVPTETLAQINGFLTALP